MFTLPRTEWLAILFCDDHMFDGCVKEMTELDLDTLMPVMQLVQVLPHKGVP